jgi:hypothetical protein
MTMTNTYGNNNTGTNTNTANSTPTTTTTKSDKNNDNQQPMAHDEPHKMRTMVGNTTADSKQRTNQEGRMTMMGMTEIPPATGTLDRKTSQVSPTACLYNQQQPLDD